MKVKKEKEHLILHPTLEDLSKPSVSSKALENALANFGPRQVLVDLSSFKQLVSLQIGTLVTFHLLCYENLAVMKLVNVNEKVKMVLRLIGLDQMMLIHHGKEVVEESFGPDSQNVPITTGEPLPPEDERAPFDPDKTPYTERHKSASPFRGDKDTDEESL